MTSVLEGAAVIREAMDGPLSEKEEEECTLRSRD